MAMTKNQKFGVGFLLVAIFAAVVDEVLDACPRSMLDDLDREAEEEMLQENIRLAQQADQQARALRQAAARLGEAAPAEHFWGHVQKQVQDGFTRMFMVRPDEGDFLASKLAGFRQEHGREPVGILIPPQAPGIN